MMMIKMLTAALMVMLKAVMKRIAKTVITFTTALYSTSQFISIMFPCSFFFFYQIKNFLFLLWVNLYMITGMYLHDPPPFNGPFFMTPLFS